MTGTATIQLKLWHCSTGFHRSKGDAEGCDYGKNRQASFVLLPNKSNCDACAPLSPVYYPSAMLRAESTHITLDGVEYDVVLHVYGEQDWRGFLIKPGSQVRIPERGASKEEVLAKLTAALKTRVP